MPDIFEKNFLSGEDIVKKAGVTGSGQLQPAPLKTPFKNVALALSGGGFRAAAYSLGTMSYLHHLKYPGPGNQRVLDNVTFISSASGGTFAGMLYSMHVMQGKPFEETYTALLRFMNGQGLLEKVLKLINEDANWPEGKSRNFINAFARVYSDSLFEEKNFGVYWPANGQATARQLEVCFNTTEFFRGLSFRFQTGNNLISTSKTGNEYLYFDKDNAASLQTLQQIKLGDIMASSSCFPAGFEPILFPKDFAYNHQGMPGNTALDVAALSKALIVEDYNKTRVNYTENIGFMDGGIDDNQGVYSAMLADKRRRRNNADKGFDLILVTDVASYFMKPYVAPVEEKTGSTNTINICSVVARCRGGIGKIENIVNGIAIASAVLFVTALLFLLLAPMRLPHDVVVAVCAVSATLLIICLAIKKYLLGLPVLQQIRQYLSLSDSETTELLKKHLPALRNFSDTAITLFVHHLKNSPLPVLQQMLKARVNSMLSLVLDINLKQTRRLIFDIFYGNFYGNDVWKNRRAFNVIYELSTFNTQSRLSVLQNKFSDKQYQLPQSGNISHNTWAEDCIDTLTTGCQQLQTVAESARTMGTTLWFDQKDANTEKMQDVVACGQFTTCAKLLEYAMIVERQLDIQNRTPGTIKIIDFDPEQLILFEKIKKQLEDDWASFKTDPHFLSKNLRA